MKKSIIITIVAIVIVSILGGAGFFVYRSSTTNKGVEKGIELINDKEYDKALASFELVLDDDANNKEAMEGKDLVSKYIDAKKLFDEGKIEEAKREIESMPSDYGKYSALKGDVDILKSKIDENLNLNKDIDKEIDKVRNLIKDKGYKEAKKIIDTLNNKELNDTQKKTVEDLNGRVDSELQKANIEVSKPKDKSNSSNTGTNMGLDKIKYLNKLKSIQNEIDKMEPGYTDPEMRQNASAEYTAWDNELNDIYGYLKNNLPQDKFKVLEKEEVQWIKDKEAKAKKNSEQYKGGTMERLEYICTLASETKNRCYELVNNYMN
ncbi:MAG: lysozyme inhibitor LprI family protein [Clostridium sp.]|uniref:lysozyme inhibitor LprI family protein n=1 Tax=Clostridium sp. TaxID=1506 RepID=UPI003F29FDDE